MKEKKPFCVKSGLGGIFKGSKMEAAEGGRRIGGVEKGRDRQTDLKFNFKNLLGESKVII